MLFSVHHNTCQHAVFLHTAVNDPPSFTPGAATITVAEDSAAYNDVWASNISAGPGEADQALKFTVNCDEAAARLFSAAPAVTAAGVLLFTPAANAFGSSRCTVVLAEVDAAGLTAEAALTVVVTAGER
jgi:hypothetical protein